MPSWPRMPIDGKSLSRFTARSGRAKYLPDTIHQAKRTSGLANAIKAINVPVLKALPCPHDDRQFAEGRACLVCRAVRLSTSITICAGCRNQNLHL